MYSSIDDTISVGNNVNIRILTLNHLGQHKLITMWPPTR